MAVKQKGDFLVDKKKILKIIGFIVEIFIIFGYNKNRRVKKRR